jgi:ABC-type Fe3+/spermidine/putrescine transport system ATPase subunit
MTVAENVGFPLKVRNVAKAETRTRVARILDIVGLGAWIDRPATQLSGGQQQRVALARALVHEPRLVLFDEPMSNLDAQLREHVRLELKVLQERLGFTAIYVTHDQSEAFALAEKIIVMNRGRIDTIGTPKDVFQRPATPFVARFLGLNVMRARVVTADASAGGVRLAQITLEDGPTLWGEIGNGHAVSAGDRVLACIRKEHVGIGASPSAATQPRSGENHTVAGEIRAASFLGLTEEYIVAMGGTELRSIQSISGVRTGDTVAVSIRPSDCIVLADPT